MVAETFLGEPSDELKQIAEKTVYGVVLVNHIDGDKQNNKVDNLEWCSHSENIKHAIDSGLITHKSGFDSHLFSANDEQIEYVLNTYKPGSHSTGFRAIARHLNICRSTVKLIVDKRSAA